jgi:hypothetical protein
MVEGKAMNIDDTLRDKESSHGNFAEMAALAQTLKAIMRRGKNWENLPNTSKEALEMIATKVSRILNGDASEPEHWNDIAGYARLQGNAFTPLKGTVDLETGISHIAKRLRPIVTRVNDEGGAP